MFKALFIMKYRQFFVFLVISLLSLSLNFPARSQVVISLIFGDELNSDKVRFGLDGGINFSRLTSIDGSEFDENFNLGFYFDIQLKENSNWYVHTGLQLKSEMGARGIAVYPLDDPDLDSAFRDGGIERTLKYINVPLLARYKFSNHFFFELGPKIGVMTKATDKFYNAIVEKEDLTYTKKVTGQYKWFDAGLEAGLGYHFMKGTGVNLGVRFYQGLMDIYRDNSGDPAWNQSLYIFASIPIGAGEKAQAKKAAKHNKTKGNP